MPGVRKDRDKKRIRRGSSKPHKLTVKERNFLENGCYLVIQSGFSRDKGQFLNTHQVLSIHG